MWIIETVCVIWRRRRRRREVCAEWILWNGKHIIGVIPLVTIVHVEWQIVPEGDSHCII